METGTTRSTWSSWQPSGPGHPVVLNTNVWVNGDGKKEHQFDLWFDPAADYHTYTIIWNPENILQGGQPLHPVLQALRRHPLRWLQPERLHATLWDGSYWATEKGKVPIDWSNAPSTSCTKNYYANACASGGACHAGSDGWMNRQLDGSEWAPSSGRSKITCATTAQMATGSTGLVSPSAAATDPDGRAFTH
ncbi:hypothetical protein ZWY2020_047863 [Hordeum vulgare]|nr:hypothetical protein ZWY2020_047863 [Hordeum vulgare]